MGAFKWRVGVLKSPQKFLSASGSASANQNLQGKNSLQIELLRPDRESEQKYKKIRLSSNSRSGYPCYMHQVIQA